MATKRVFIVSRHPLFSQGVEDLLKQRGGLVLLGHEQDGDAALACIQALAADVVIIDCDSRHTEFCALITRMLALAPPVRVIGVSLQNNALYIFRREEKVVATVDDLLAAIES